jgi:serine phosphatase RsbU (regulator of sigma subunit)
VEERLLAIAKKFWPELETMSGPERRDGVRNVVGFLYSAPLALVGLVWLMTATDLTLFRTEWPTLSLLFVLLFLFERLGFFFFIEVTPGTYSDWQASLGMVIIWSAALIFGPSALWLLIFHELIYYARRWQRSTSVGSRWSCLRNFTVNLAEETFASLVALTLYEHWGGVFPLPGVTLEQVLPAFYATFIRWLLSVLILIPLLGYLVSPQPLIGGSLGAYIKFWAVGLGWGFLVSPFAILAAGLYVQNGLGGYLFFVAGLLLASFLAHQLSQAVERSQQRSRELEKLEQLGRAMITCCPDASDLPEVLKEHVSNMFPYSQIEIRIFPHQTLLHHPKDWPPVGAPVWEWLRTTSEARYFSPEAALPWDKQPTSNAVVVAPILDVETTEPIGGIYLSRRRDLDTLAVPNLLPAVLPAVQSLAAQVASALNGAKVYEQTLAHQRVEQELVLAGQIQASFLPGDLPHVPGWQLTATLEPARQTSGDFYDVIPLQNGRFAIVVADVADKGMGAALYMALSRTLIRTYAVEYHTRPDDVLRVANHRILADAQAGLFVTVFYGLLDPTTGTLTYCNAGHNPPYLLSARNKDSVQALRRTGMPLGIAGGVTWEQEVVQLGPGDMLVLCTDGVTEAQDAQETFFGTERLLEVVRTNLGRPAQEVQDALLAEVHEFVGNAPQFDDIALMVVVRGSAKARQP